MKYFVDESLTNFKFWSGAADNAAKLTYDQLEQLDDILSEMYPDGCSDTTINDIMWFDFEQVKEWLGLQLNESDFEYIVDDFELVLDNGLKVELSTSTDSSGTCYLDGSVEYEDEDGEENSIDDYVEFDFDNYDKDEAEECLTDAIKRLKKRMEEQLGISGIGLVSALNPRFDSRASFYGKAQIDDHDDHIGLYSYDTEVARFDKQANALEVFGYYSATTARHIREFARQLGITLPKGKDIEGVYYL